MPQDRQTRLLEIINARGLVSLAELEHLFPEVSSMTLRRDLQRLDERGEAIRVRRGVRAVHKADATDGIEPTYVMRAAENLPAKDAIAAAALPHIELGRSIYFDAGSTVMRLARIMPDRFFSAVTPAPNIALALGSLKNPEVCMLGGSLQRDNNTVIGPQTQVMFEGINVDTAILSASGYAQSVGFTCGNPSECEQKQRVLAKARNRMLLMDQSKLDRMLPLTFCRLDGIGTLVIDGPPQSPAAEALLSDAQRHGVTVILAPPLPTTRPRSRL